LYQGGANGGQFELGSRAATGPEANSFKLTHDPEMQPLDNVLPCPDDPIVQGVCLGSIFSCGDLQ
jgi:hypothetical protein